MKDLLETLVKKLVDKPEEVVVTETGSNGMINFRIKVATDDIGKILGKKGQTITALRTISKAIGAKEAKKKVIIDLDEY